MTELTEKCIGDCDNCQYAHYITRTKYFYEEPVLSCRLVEKEMEENEE